MIKNFLIRLIKFYQKYISGLKSTKCPYIPTCSQYGLEAIEKYGAFKGSLLSEYGMEAIEKHGTLKGGFLAIYRIIRCNPFSKGGYDPVP